MTPLGARVSPLVLYLKDSGRLTNRDLVGGWTLFCRINGSNPDWCPAGLLSVDRQLEVFWERGCRVYGVAEGARLDPGTGGDRPTGAMPRAFDSDGGTAGALFGTSGRDGMVETDAVLVDPSGRVSCRYGPVAGHRLAETILDEIERLDPRVVENFDDPRPVDFPNRAIFRDPEVEADFRRNGFVIGGALDQAAVRWLLQRYASLGRPWVPGQIYSTVLDQPPDVSRAIGEHVREAVAPVVTSWCQGYRPVGGTLMVKGTDAESECKLHQDPSQTVETCHPGLGMWIPLVDVDADNGCLVAAPGSHRPGLFPLLRPLNQRLADLPLGEDLEFALVDLPMTAGQICWFSPALFHGSRPNHTATPRPAVLLVSIPDEAELLEFEHLVGDTFRVFSIDPEFHYGGDARRELQDRSGSFDDRLVVSKTHRVSRHEFIEVMAGEMARSESGSPTAR